MIRATIPIQFHVLGPVLTRASAIGQPGIDAAMAAGTFFNSTGQKVCKYYLPGTLIRGLLREAWQELAAVDPAFSRLPAKWLGETSKKTIGDEETNEPERGRVLFSDFVDWTHDTREQQRNRTRIQIDPKMGAAHAGMMQVMTAPYAAGQPICFEGNLRVLLSDSEPLEELLRPLSAGLRWIRALGACRSAGFGRVATVVVGNPDRESPQPAPPAERWTVALTFDSPVIFSKHRVSNNLFESGETIPGAALKGCIAEMIKPDRAKYQSLLNELHAVGFSHGFPSKDDAPRPSCWPLSLAEIRTVASPMEIPSEMYDCLQYEQPPPEREVSFDIDWKNKTLESVREKYGWPEEEYELRVRTAIAGEKGSAGDGQLFAWNMRLPYDVTWRATVDASRVSDAARRQLAELISFGIEPLGKTKALAATGMAIDKPGNLMERGDGFFVVTLQTPALLVDPNRHLAPDGTAGTTALDAMRAEYADVWKELSGGSLRLTNHFHRLTLSGGEYFRRRFSHKHNYRPFLLTDPGSVFVLSPVPGREAAAKEKLANWIKSGLPVSASVRGFYQIGGVPDERLWERCPYLPENGYGEITVNQSNPYPELPCIAAR